MSTNHDAVAALPINAAPNQTLLRNVLVARMPYVLADADDSRNLIAIDPITGATIVDLLLLGRVFHWDPADFTTSHDGTSCLVSSDGLRYKLAVGTDVFAYAVIDSTHTAPPASPALGDAYLVAAGATGAWAGKSNTVAVKTARGWEFVNFSIGRFIYVEALDSYYHRNAGGSWVVGMGSQAIGANAVPLSSIINVGRVFKVENQTTNAPPGSPAIGDAYIIGSSPTGAWAGNSLKVAICEVGTTFTIYTPVQGDIAWDKATGAHFRYTGAAWVSMFGAWTTRGNLFTALGSLTQVISASIYTFDPNTAPTTSQYYTQDNVTHSIAAPSGAKIRFTYSGDFTVGNSSDITAGIWRDSVAAAIDWNVSTMLATQHNHRTFVFETTAPDSTSHTYTARFMAYTGPVAVGAVYRRHFSYEVAV